MSFSIADSFELISEGILFCKEAYVDIKGPEMYFFDEI